MDDNRLKAILDAKITNSLGFQGGRLSADRQKAWKYYNGDLFGNEQPGRSQVVSHDVAEVVDGIMPSLIKIFTSGDQVVRFEPSEPGDEEAAKQATDYANWIFYQQNAGFRTLYTWFKDALATRLGIVKSWWDEREEKIRETYRGLDETEFGMLLSDPDVEMIEHTASPAPMPIMDPSQQMVPQLMGATAMQAPPPGMSAPPAMAMVHDVTVLRTNKEGRVRIMPVPPDEFLVEHRAVTLNRDTFCAHRSKKTVSELVELGYPKSTVERLSADSANEYTTERIERFKAEDEAPYNTTNALDPSMREVWVTECYVKIDYDGDGVAEYRKVTVAGEGGAYEILDNDEVDNHPFAALTPIIMPHKLFGQSMTDQVQDLQLIKSTLWRGALDSIYLANAPMVWATKGANLDDLLTRRPGGVVRVSNPTDTGPLAGPVVAQEAFQMMEMVDGVRENRTGVTRYNQGLDANSLNKTATGINIIQSSGQQRVELIARVFAETGMIDLFRRILELITKHQNKPRMIRLRKQWAAMDPSGWNSRMDMVAAVGLGNGNKDQQLAHAMMLYGVQKDMVLAQKGLQGPLVTGENIFALMDKVVEGAGFKSTETYFTDPASPEGKQALQRLQQQPDPQVEEAKAKVAVEQARQQTEQARQQTEQMKQHNEMRKTEIHMVEAQTAQQEAMTHNMVAQPAAQHHENMAGMAQAMTALAQSLQQMFAASQAANADTQRMLAMVAQGMMAPKSAKKGPDGTWTVAVHAPGMMQ